jgi:glucose/mannose-6-phosphate isomerase
MYSDIFTFDRQCINALNNKVRIEFDPSSIFICGMGGSAIAGDIIKRIVKEIPVTVVRDYELPIYADKESLIIIVSYSGNTEETLACYSEAVKRKLNIVVITSGGFLEEDCKKRKIPVIKIPNDYQPRAALGYLLFSIISLLQNSDVIEMRDDIKEAIKIVKDNKQIMDDAKILAGNLAMSVPLIYASNNYYGAAMRWKTQINENAKQMAFFNTFSEMNHNEIVGFNFIPRNFHVVLLRDKDDNERIIKRMDILKETMTKVAFFEINAKGKSMLAKMLYFIHLGDWTSYYLALINGVDPTPVDIINDLKNKLK